MKHKSLHESAAEILAASVAGAGKEPLPMSTMLTAPPVDLGGEMTTGDVTAVGAGASAATEESPKPGKTGAPAEEMKAVETESAETEKEEDEEEGEEEKPEAMMESLIVEHGDAAVFNTIMEEYVSEHGAELVQEAFVATLIEEIGEEQTIDILLESIVNEFGEQELTDEDFEVLKEQSDAFIAEMDVLSEEDISNYLSNLDEEQLVYAIQLASLNEGFLKKIGKAIKKVGKTALKVVGKVAPVLSFVPGVGTALGAVAGKVLGGIGSKIAGSALGKAVSAGASKLGSSVIGKGILNAGKGALQGGISSVLQGGKFKEGAKLGAVSGIASPLVNKVAGGLTKITGSETLGQTAADALAGGVASKALGGKFSAGAKTGAIGSVVGRVGQGIGDAVRGRLGDQAGNIAQNFANQAGQNAAARVTAPKPTADSGEEQPEQNDQTPPVETTAVSKDQEEPVNAPEKKEEETPVNPPPKPVVAPTRKIGRGFRKRGGMVAEEQDLEIFNELATLNEEQLDRFIETLDEEEVEFLSNAINEGFFDFLVNPNKENRSAPGKPGIGIFRDAAGKKTALRKAIPNELANIPGFLGRLGKIKELGYDPKDPMKGTDRYADVKAFVGIPATPDRDRYEPEEYYDRGETRRRPSSGDDGGYNLSSSEQEMMNKIVSGLPGDGDSSSAEYYPSDRKTGIGIFRTPTGEKTALRKAIPNELVGAKDLIGNIFKIKELGWRPGTNRLGYPMNENIEDSNMNGEETTMETQELTEEQIREQRMLAIKEAVKQFKGNMREDVDALFNGESLSEEFRAKATLIFESAVSSRVESILEQVMEQNDAVLAQAYDDIKDQLTEQVDEYLNYVVEQWMAENQIAVETGLRAELAEDFISGLRALFQEHYIEIPDEKVDVAETLASELEQAGEYVDTVHQHIEAQNAAIADLQEQLNAVKKEKAIDNFCEGLTLVQAEKMKSLAEGVEFTAEGDFEEKLAVLRENYFPTKVQVKSEVKELQQVALNEEPEVAQTNNIMERYVKSISKTAPKA